MSIKLEYQALEELPNAVDKPNYSRESLSAGIIHIGVGNFHRAHQAMYLHKLFNLGEALDWAIKGAGITPYDKVMRDRLKSQDWLTTVVEVDANGLQAQVCASMVDFIENDVTRLIDALCDENIRIVSLTITEGGYYIDEKMGSFDLHHPDIQGDIDNFSRPTTIFGVLLNALRERRNRKILPFTILSCDNIPHNGDVAKRSLIGMAKEIDPDLAQWIEKSVTFPNSMVDCITPATSELKRKRLAEEFGLIDQAPVFCEPFRQWIIEDKFANGRPPLEKVGVEFVEDVTPFELMKLRVLNGGHASLAFPAALMGIDYVHDAISNPLLGQYLRKLTREEIIPTLDDIPNLNFYEYSALIESRFANPEVRDTVSRLCQDSSDRLPKFILPMILANYAQNKDQNGLALVIALWCRLCGAAAESDSNIEIQDKQADRLIKKASLAKKDPIVFLQMSDIFGTLANIDAFKNQFAKWLKMLWKKGISGTIETYLQES